MIVNIHERAYAVPVSEVAALIATLASKDDRFWPYECWPRMHFDRGLVTGASGGHGPVRYRVEHVDPANKIVFQFTSPTGFDGGHALTITSTSESETTVRHEIRLHPHSLARLTWPLFFRPMHDALLEEAFDKLARNLGVPSQQPHQRSVWVRLLRWVTKTDRQPQTSNTIGS
ncbi:hypothetical protein [Timonella sp. A28]|uniref:hypothetical protein n=1 Tax=Timonella sp. A28 TaxID=3442640 RepID=UPI003EBAD3B4